MTQNFYNGASAAVIVYDVTDEKSLESALTWLDDVRSKAPQNCEIALAGNKVDLIEEVVISKQQGTKFANNQGIDIFMETSAKEGIGIKELMEKLCITINAKKRDQRESVMIQR